MTTGYSVPTLLNRINEQIAEVKRMGEDGRMNPRVAVKAQLGLVAVWHTIDDGRVAYRKDNKT